VNTGLTLDKVDRLTPRQRAREAAHFSKVRNAETTYATQLRKVARHIGDLVRQLYTGDPAATAELVITLRRYADLLNPWARATAARLLAEVARRDETAWRWAAAAIGSELRTEIAGAPIGDEVRRLLAEQVGLITSLPLDAAQRVQALALEGATTGRRYGDLVQEINRTGHVTIGRANLIARTETAKAQSAITQARARYVGSDAYTWISANDRDVRPAHKRLAGHVFRWDDPPIAEEGGQRHHPGEFPNCRCYAEPVLPAVIK
jgi:SPP1 gp7 family putative phage head morphogenesis protein